MNRRGGWQPCWPYTPARETRGQPSIAPTMPTNTAQSDPAEPLKTADLPLHYAENGASPPGLPVPTRPAVRARDRRGSEASSITRALARARAKKTVHNPAGYKQHNDDYNNHSDLGGVATTVRTQGSVIGLGHEAVGFGRISPLWTTSPA